MVSQNTSGSGALQKIPKDLARNDEQNDQCDHVASIDARAADV